MHNIPLLMNVNEGRHKLSVVCSFAHGHPHDDPLGLISFQLISYYR